MRNRIVKKVVKGTLIFLALSTIVLAVHIYVVTRPKPPGEHTRIMARIDIEQPINQTDARKITAWLYQQKGIDHVLVNPQSRIVVFTYYPIKTNADVITKNFVANLHYTGKRITASKDDLASGCPVSNTSITYKIYNFFRNI
jgi:hypothetical protein